MATWWTCCVNVLVGIVHKSENLVTFSEKMKAKLGLDEIFVSCNPKAYSKIDSKFAGSKPAL